MSPNKKGKRPKSLSPQKKPLHLPRYIQNELRTTCAMRRFSKMKAGKKMCLNDQWEFMAKFFHGRPPNYPSQIELLVEGCVAYSELYEEIEITAKKKRMM